MNVALKVRQWTADAFVAADQEGFGPLWRYELVDGRVVGHAAPSPEHGAIVIGLGSALQRALRGKAPGCRPEAGSAATPRTEQRNTARIPDIIIRCGDLPRVAFEIISPSELRSMRARDLKRMHLQAVEGMEEIVEIFQDDYACHVYRREESGRWTFEALGGRDGVLRLESVGVEVSLADIYELAPPPDRDQEG